MDGDKAAGARLAADLGITDPRWTVTHSQISGLVVAHGRGMKLDPVPPDRAARAVQKANAQLDGQPAGQERMAAP